MRWNNGYDFDDLQEAVVASHAYKHVVVITLELVAITDVNLNN